MKSKLCLIPGAWGTKRRADSSYHGVFTTLLVFVVVCSYKFPLSKRVKNALGGARIFFPYMETLWYMNYS